MTDRERRDYFFFVMRSWRLEMERSQQYVKAMEKSDPGGSAAAGTQTAAAATTAEAATAQSEPEVAPAPETAGMHATTRPSRAHPPALIYPCQA